MTQASLDPNQESSLSSICEALEIDSLRPFQKDAVETVLSGHDCLVVAPTSSGKSLCYIAPSLVLSGLVLVISPLISLMRDQIRELKEKGVLAASLDSMQTPQEKSEVLEAVRAGGIRLLFVSPERLALPSFRSFIQDLPVSLVAIDEAHCVNQWGLDFRPEYSRISQYLKDCFKGPKIALTATARIQDREKIIELLDLNNPKTIVLSKARENLSLKVFRAKTQDEHLNLMLQSVLSAQGSGIVYCATRKQCDGIGAALRRAGISVGVYHAGMMSFEREEVYHQFMVNDIDVVVATKAFGMGINKRDIRYVFHASLPSSIEAYAQEIGRAGRDGADARCYMFFTSRDYHIQKYMIDKSFPSDAILEQVFKVLPDLFQSGKSMLETSFQDVLIKELDVSKKEIDTSLDFLYREKVLKRMDLVRDSWSDQGIDVLVTFNEDHIPLGELKEDITLRKNERIDRLSAIYDLAKGDKKPEFYMERYFS